MTSVVCVFSESAAAVCDDGVHVWQPPCHRKHRAGASQADAEHQVPAGTGGPAQRPPSSAPGSSGPSPLKLCLQRLSRGPCQQRGRSGAHEAGASPRWQQR
jgi:hypothetical protein